MKTKAEIIENWLPRYTGMPLKKFGKYIIICNFHHYLERFAGLYGVAIAGINKPMQSATHGNITILNFGMGSPSAATAIDLLSAIAPKAILFLGKCGSLKSEIKLGEFILPIAAIRGEGTSNDYVLPEVPALPAFAMQKAISTTIREHERDYWTGTCYSTNRRIWEHDEAFKQYLKRIRAMAIDMETATVFSVGFANKIPTGALLLVSDEPMTPEGVKTTESDATVTKEFADLHLEIGIQSLQQLIEQKLTVRHLKF